jgi:hypothetical protein
MIRGAQRCDETDSPLSPWTAGYLDRVDDFKPIPDELARARLKVNTQANSV